MKKKWVIFLSAAFLCLAGTASAKEEGGLKRFNFKLSGGFGGGATGDIQAVLGDQNVLFEDTASLLNYTKTGVIEWKEAGRDFEFEFVLGVTDNFGIGLGFEHLRRGADCSSEIVRSSYGSEMIEVDPVYTIIPLNLNLYYYFPMGSAFEVYIKSGIGYYKTKVDFIWRKTEEMFSIRTWDKIEGILEDKNVGFHGGIGFEWAASENFSFFVEGMGRYTKLGSPFCDVELSNSDGISQIFAGTLFRCESYDSSTGKNYANFSWGEDYFDVNYSNLRNAGIGFSGLSIKIGIRIGFGR